MQSLLAWFAHVGQCQGPLESTTLCAQRQVQDLQAARSVKERLPRVFRAREQKAMKNNFPFSSHDNRHCLQNVGEYFDSGMGQRKVEPQRSQQKSHNFIQWAPQSLTTREDGSYRTSFPKHHSEKSYTDKPAPESEKKVQPDKSSLT